MNLPCFKCVFPKVPYQKVFRPNYVNLGQWFIASLLCLQFKHSIEAKKTSRNLTGPKDKLSEYEAHLRA